MEDAKEEILSYEEFADLKEAEKEKQEQDFKMVEVSVDTMDEAHDVGVSEEVETEIRFNNN